MPIDEELYIRDELGKIKDERNKKYLGTYSSFDGSPLSKGLFQFDLWNTEPITKVNGLKLDWDKLRNNVIEFGVRNSLLLAPMPTASTSQILGNNECIEPFTSNIYSRNTIAGTFVVINKYLLHDLINIGLWTNEIKKPSNVNI